MSNVDEFLDVISQVLWRCIVAGVVFVFLWAAAFFVAGERINGQAAWFGLTPHECALVHYAGMGIVKMLVMVFFLFPYIAIRLVLRKRKLQKGRIC